MALPLRTSGALSPTFVPARHVRRAVKLPSAFTLSRAISIRTDGTFGRLSDLLGVDRPSLTARLILSCDPIQGRQLEF